MVLKQISNEEFEKLDPSDFEYALNGLEDKTLEHFALMDDWRTLGVFSVQIPDGSENRVSDYVCWVEVPKQYRHRGYASEMLKRFLALNRRTCCLKLRSFELIPLYEPLGFKIMHDPIDGLIGIHYGE
jgi:GNAT superfamily N-acetyltransferase